MKYTSVCRDTLGELYQGPIFIRNAIEISIISATSHNKTLAVFTPGVECNLREIEKFKVQQALDNYFSQINQSKLEGYWKFESDLTVGTGMSSSTADIVAALRCIAKATSQILTIQDIMNSLVGIERSDFVFIDYPCLYLSQQQSIVDLYKPQPKIYCIYSLEKYTCDTSQTKEILLSYYSVERKRYLKLQNAVQKAFATHNTSEIINCSTQSALLSQEVFPKKQFNFFFKNIKKVKAHGLIVAHTGSLIGFLYLKKPNIETVKATKKIIQEQNIEAYMREIF